MINILHTEASPGWGGQEIRILNEAKGMRNRGFNIILVIQSGGKLVEKAIDENFIVYEMPFNKLSIPFCVARLVYIIIKHNIDIVNTHSSLDAWSGGIAARICRRKIIRTRHLSTKIKPGINSRLLYGYLADSVVTTCKETADVIRKQANIPPTKCLSIPTGVQKVTINYNKVREFRKKFNINVEDCIVGTVCIIRVWKGLLDLLQAAKKLQHINNLKWVIIGSGVSENWLKEKHKQMGLEDNVILTRYIEKPWEAIEAMDIFILLSTANEGVSQASLQAAYLKKPLITTDTGGLGEVCIHNKTGLQVPTFSPDIVASSVLQLYQNKDLRTIFGINAHNLVMENFTMEKTLNDMEGVISNVLPRF